MKLYPKLYPSNPVAARDKGKGTKGTYSFFSFIYKKKEDKKKSIRRKKHI